MNLNDNYLKYLRMRFSGSAYDLRLRIYKLENTKPRDAEQIKSLRSKL